jgi:Flp pilus assembly protein TadD
MSSLHSLRRGGLRRAVLVSAALGLVLSACAFKGPLDSLPTGSIASQPATPADLDKQVQYWGDRYNANQKNRDIALNYASALRQTGKNDQAVAVLAKTAGNFPKDRDVLAAYGRALAAAGRLPEALEAVQRAETPDKPDWKLISTEASIRDQMGDAANARKLHAQAAANMPGDPTILSNYGMSYVLTGELAQAEILLSQAAALPNADTRTRQNLALVVGLEGRFDEAQKIASADLPPDQAAANIAYLKKMLAQQNTWQTLQSGGKTATTTPAKTPPPPAPAKTAAVAKPS